MVGQGSPQLISVSVTRWTWHRMCIFLRPLSWCVLLCALTLTSSLEAQAVDLRLRVAWGGGTARQWQGALSVQQGSLSRLSYLGLDADEAATIFLDKNTVQINQRSGRDYDGFDLHVAGSIQSVVTLEIAPVTNPEERQRIEVPLEELISGYRHAELDSSNNQILIQRASGDTLRTIFDRPSLVFAPGESFEFQVAPHLTGLEDLKNLRCQVLLFRVGSDDSLWEQDYELVVDAGGEFKPIGPITVPLPETEGVYQIAIRVLRKRFVNTFVRSKPLLQREVQVVVVADKPPAANAKSFELIDTIDPNHASWMEWLSRVPKLPLLPEFRQEPLGNEKSKVREHLGQELVELAPGGWQAYPTTTGETGKPHILEVEYPSDLVQTLGISIMEPNAVGKVVPLGLDSGVDVPQGALTGAPRMLRHRLIFWPRTSAPLVLLTNRRDDKPAVFGRIRIYAGPDALPAQQQPGAAMLNSPRLLAAYFDRPLFPENFTAPEAADAWSGRSLKDWVTFYEGGTRLVEYLKHVGYNGAIVSVACQGGTIYPSKLLTPIPKYDTGTFFASGQDPVQKDVLEMLFRLFDREGLTLIPAVHFSSTLEELEKTLRNPLVNSEGIALIDRQGATWQQGHGANRGMAPHYNPLDRRVQQAMRRVVKEITERYNHHRSFGGMSLQLGPETYAVLPGEHWAADQVTQKRFEQDNGIPATGSTKPAITGARSRDRQRLWLQWRAGVLAQFHRDILADVQTLRPDARLYLLGGDLLTNPDPNLQSHLKPTIPNRLRVDEVLLQLGIVAENYKGQNQIVFFRPERTAPRTPLANQAVNINLATNSAADHAFSEFEPAASLFYHERLTLSLPSFDAQSPFGQENTRTVLFTHATPSAEYNRQRFVHHLAQRDVQSFVDGGWMLPLGQEDSLRELLGTLAQLPARKFETIIPKATTLPTQPLVVRTLAHDGLTYIYVINDSPWTVSAEVDIESPERCELKPLGKRPFAQPTWLGRRLTWAVDLEPFDVIAAVFSSDKASVRTWRVSVDRATYAQLRRQIEELSVRALKLKRPDPINVLRNPSFEGSPDRLPGWIHANGAGFVFGPDASTHVDGGQSLKIVSRSPEHGPVAWIRSDPFDPPKTGRITVVVRLRTDDPGKQPPLSLAIDGKYLDGKGYYKAFPVGRGSKFPIGNDWGNKPYLFEIDNLPANELANIRVGFDLMAAGSVWIDDVRIYDRWFPQHEQDDLMITHGLAFQLLRERKITDCQRILNGYWPQFLLHHISADAAQVADLPTNAPNGDGATFPPPQTKPTEEQSSMLDKVKKLPSKVFPFRFR